MAGRASPAGRADEDVHNPSVDGVRCVSGARECAKIRYFRSYAGVATADRADGPRYVSKAGVVFLLFF